MDTLDLGLKLHDRATRGEKLTVEEQALLDAWYKEQDDNEAEALMQTDTDDAVQMNAQETINMLRSQIDTILVDLAEKTKQIQTLIEQNNRLRTENSALQQQLVQPDAVNAA